MKWNVGTSIWMVCTTFTIISSFGYYRSQIMVEVERECYKSAGNNQTLLTNRLQETLVLTRNTKTTIFGKASLLTMTNDLVVLWHFNASLASSCIFVQKSTYLRDNVGKILLNVIWAWSTDNQIIFNREDVLHLWTKKREFWRSVSICTNQTIS